MIPIFATWTKNVYVSYLEKNNKEEEVEQAENWTCFRTDDETDDALGPEYIESWLRETIDSKLWTHPFTPSISLISSDLGHLQWM